MPKQRLSKPARRRHSKRRARRGLFGRLLWFFAGVVIGLSGPWIWWLDREAGVRFAERQWTQAGRVYARPLELYAGMALDAADLELELRAAGLAPGDSSFPGRFARDRGRFDLHLPAFVFAEETQPARRVALEVEAGAVRTLNAGGDAGARLIRVPPAELGSLLPLDDRDRTLVALADFPPLLVTGIQAVEDTQFRHHHGLDPKAMLRAAWRNLRRGDVVEGGSTITQQLVKNLFLTPDRRWLRKFNEAVMAVSLERRYSKAEILEAYLNEVYLGQSGASAVHGFGRASEHYFGLPVQALSTEQIALLVGMVRGASWYNPVRNPERARARRDRVLDRFLAMGLIDAESHAAARARPLGVRGGNGARPREGTAFMDLVRRQLRSDYRDRDLRERGLRIFTTMSPSAQRHAERALADGLHAVEGQPGELQGAVVLVEPDTGEVRALVGDRDAARAGFNRALDARRPVGSVIKPFVYLLALADAGRYSLVTMLDDSPLSVPQAGRESWRPRNHDGISHGPVPLMTALASSYNQASVRLGLDVGVDGLFRLLEQLGVAPGSARHPAALLGAIDLTPLQVAQLYQPLAAEGYSTSLRAITDVVDGRGRPVARYTARLRPIRERAALAVLDFALREAVRNGTGHDLDRLLRSPGARRADIRGKTGTTNERRDAWFVGYTPEWLGVVWIGRDDHGPAAIGGASTALPVWAGLFDRLPHQPGNRSWPEGIEWYWIDWPAPLLAAEYCAGARALPFVAGSQPVEHSPCLDTDRRPVWRRR